MPAEGMTHNYVCIDVERTTLVQDDFTWCAYVAYPERERPKHEYGPTREKAVANLLNWLDECGLIERT